MSSRWCGDLSPQLMGHNNLFLGRVNTYRHFSGIHFSSSRHLNSVGRQFNLLHLKSLSSELSPQSLLPSHFQLLGIHFPLAQVKWSTLKFKKNNFFIVAGKKDKMVLCFENYIWPTFFSFIVFDSSWNKEKYYWNCCLSPLTDIDDI